MRKNNNIEEVFMTLDEIIDEVSIIESNRTSYMDEKENHAKGYNSVDLKSLETRVSKYGAMFKKVDYEWNDATPMTIHVIRSEGNKKYLSDGNGRKCSFLVAMSKGEIRGDKEIPVRLVYRDTMDELIGDMKAMNNFHVNWTADDVLRANAINGVEDSWEIYLLYKQYQEELGGGKYPPRLILFGYANVKRDYIPTKLADLSPFREDVLGFFKRFYNFFDNEYETELGNKKRLARSIRNQDTAIALYKFFTGIIRACDKDADRYKKVTDMILGKMFESFRGISPYEIKQILTGKKNKIPEQINYFLRKKTKNKIIRDALDYMLEVKSSKITNSLKIQAA